MNDNFEKDVSYFIKLVFNNIQFAKTRKNKTEAVFYNLNVKLNGEEISVFNMEKNHSYNLFTKEIQNYNFKKYLIQYLALTYIDKLTKYANNEIAFEELAEIKEEAAPIVKNILAQKNNISEQLKLLRKNRNIIEVQQYIDSLYNHKYATAYLKYLIDRYYYNINDLERPKKNCIERMFKLLLR